MRGLSFISASQLQTLCTRAIEVVYISFSAVSDSNNYVDGQNTISKLMLIVCSFVQKQNVKLRNAKH